MAQERPPFDVLMRGPQAVADWLEQREKRNKHRIDTMITRYEAIVRAAGIAENMDTDQYAIAMAATIFAATTMVYSVRGMRGPARDKLSEFIDTSFDLIDDLEANNEAFRDALAELRRAAK